MRGTSLHTWKGGFRVQDCAVSSDGRRLVAADTDSKIHVFDFETYEEVICFPVSSKPTSVAISRDSKHMLVSLAEGEIQLLEMDTSYVIRRFTGQKQGEFVIRSTFGGADENFVVSGSEGEYYRSFRKAWLYSRFADSQVYIWHKDNGKHVETLGGHISGCVNSISWNPTNATMFASAGDDCAVRM
jgi:WD40 repeat protein